MLVCFATLMLFKESVKACTSSLYLRDFSRVSASSTVRFSFSRWSDLISLAILSLQGRGGWAPSHARTHTRTHVELRSVGRRGKRNARTDSDAIETPIEAQARLIVLRGSRDCRAWARIDRARFRTHSAVCPPPFSFFFLSPPFFPMVTIPPPGERRTRSVRSQTWLFH